VSPGFLVREPEEEIKSESEQKKAMIDVCCGVTAECVNPDSYGEICVGCNQCGRFTRLDRPKPLLEVTKFILRAKPSSEWKYIFIQHTRLRQRFRHHPMKYCFVCCDYWYELQVRIAKRKTAL
jgi:hypothetical protein